MLLPKEKHFFYSLYVLAIFAQRTNCSLNSLHLQDSLNIYISCKFVHVLTWYCCMTWSRRRLTRSKISITALLQDVSMLTLISGGKILIYDFKRSCTKLLLLEKFCRLYCSIRVEKDHCHPEHTLKCLEFRRGMSRPFPANFVTSNYPV